MRLYIVLWAAIKVDTNDLKRSVLLTDLVCWKLWNAVPRCIVVWAPYTVVSPHADRYACRPLTLCIHSDAVDLGINS